MKKRYAFFILLIGMGLYIVCDWYKYKSARLFYYDKTDCVVSAKYKDVPLEQGWGVYICKRGDEVKTEILLDPAKLER